MFHHSSSRNHRSKGSNVKRILQLTVLLAVACWLIYQVKQSHQKKAEFAGNNEIKLSKTGEEISLGRKGDAGSENVVIIDVNTQVSDDSTVTKQDEVRHDTSILNNEDNRKEMPQSDELMDSQESKPDQHDHSHANDGNEHDDSKDGEKPENAKTDSAVGEGGEATVAGEETTSSSPDQTQSGKIAGKENEEASGESSGQEVSTDVEASKGMGVDSDEHNNSSSKISIDGNVDDHAGDDARINDVDAFQGESDANHEAEAAGVENEDANIEASEGGGVSEVEIADNNSSGETKTESENVAENSSKANSNDDGNSQNNSKESKNETENPEESAVGDAVESQGNEDGKSEENSNDASEKESSSVNVGAVPSTEVSEKINSDDSSTEIPAGEAARSETESDNGGHREESNKSEQSSDMEAGEEGAALQVQ